MLPPTILVIGALIVLAAGFLGGATGFGFALLGTPLLLLIGLPLKFVVTLILFLSVCQRISTVVRLRKAIWYPRAGMLVLGSIPGTILGSWLAVRTDTTTLKRVAGIVVIVAVVWQLLGSRRPPPPPIPGAALIAGMLSGILGTTTSLSGPPVVILLARDRVPPRVFQADLAFYFVVSSAISLLLLLTRGALVRMAIFPVAALWLPGTLLGNWIGITVSTRLNAQTFRYVTYIVAGLSGIVTAVTA